MVSHHQVPQGLLLMRPQLHPSTIHPVKKLLKDQIRLSRNTLQAIEFPYLIGKDSQGCVIFDSRHFFSFGQQGAGNFLAN